MMISKKETGWNVPIRTWCNDLEKSALEQAVNLAKHPVVRKHVALMPDCHTGYGMPIGGVIGTKTAIIPNAVGVDIGCGIRVARTNTSVNDISKSDLKKLVSTIKNLVPCGEGKSHAEKQEWGGKIESCSLYDWYSKDIESLAYKNIGTLGGGNHFIELQKCEDGCLWVMVHSGSRNLGYVIASHHHKIAKNLNSKYYSHIPCNDLAFLPTDSQEGKNYISDMNFALSYAKENRKRIMQKVTESIEDVLNPFSLINTIDIHHNYATIEHHFNENLWIHRKGAISAKEKEVGVIPGSMGTNSYMVEGLGNRDSFMSCSHGAGRKMGRMDATKNLIHSDCEKKMEGIMYDGFKLVKKGKTKGMIDLGEAPDAYKDIDMIIKSSIDLVKPITKLRPIAVIKG